MANLPPAYFDELYRNDPDPWRFTTSPYEAGKYDATLAALPRQHYASALEIGCSLGVLTQRLASRCGSLLATDVAAAALADARARNADFGHVRFEQRIYPHDLPGERFSLIVLSEVLYYLDAETLEAAAIATVDVCQPGADIMLVHWLGETPDYPLSGDEAAEGFIGAISRRAGIVSQQRRPDYRIDVLRLA